MKRIGRIYVSSLKLVVALLFALLILVAFYQVVSRYALGITPAWSEEVARYLAVWLVLLTSALAIDLNNHISIDLLPNALPRTGRRLILLVSWVITFAFLLVLLRESLNLVLLSQNQNTPGIGIPMAYVYAGVPVAAGCMLISAARAFWSFIRDERRGPAITTHEDPV